ncbi:hypothetical protein BZA70DRAFT_291763 [Myxozyma melibiosi]|uniref:Nonsense-mediated mRNA decay factor n=1 Tax=Myxozyma melibiosi TaxID=54550 RepID=A0ABR1EZH1_9ASCO
MAPRDTEMPRSVKAGGPIEQKLRDLRALIKVRPPYHKEVEELVIQIREAAMQSALADIEGASKANLDNDLWIKVHHPMNEAYAKLLSKIGPQMKTKPTEARKLQEFYVKFIKSAMYFYRSYIQALENKFGVQEIVPVVTRIRMQVGRGTQKERPNETIQTLVVRSCHRSLLSLGDLSRYREIHSLDFSGSSSDKDYRPAINYYTLAKELVPQDGSPYNQFAVISSLEGSVLGSTYHFYRSMCVEEPFPTASGNLVLSLRKTLKGSSGNLVPRNENGGDSRRRDELVVAALLEKFLHWHAQVTLQSSPKLKDAERDNFVDIDNLTAEIIAQLEADLKGRRLTTDILQRMVIINVAAYYVSTLDGSMSNNTQATNQFLAFNLKFFQSLLATMLSEMDVVRTRQAVDEVRDRGVSAVARRLLPAVRIYSLWIRITVATIQQKSVPGNLTSFKDAVIGDLAAFWNEYCDAMSSASIVFGSLSFEKNDTLLKEDLELIGFKPLQSGLTGIRAEALYKNISELEACTSRAHPTEEAFWRISDILADADVLANKEEVPIVYEDEKYVYFPPPATSTPADGAAAAPPPDFNSQPLYPHPSLSQNQPQAAFVDPAIASFADKRGNTAAAADPLDSRMMSAMVDSLLEDEFGNPGQQRKDDELKRNSEQENIEKNGAQAGPTFGSFSSPWPTTSMLPSMPATTTPASPAGPSTFSANQNLMQQFYSPLTSGGAFNSVAGTSDYLHQPFAPNNGYYGFPASSTTAGPAQSAAQHQLYGGNPQPSQTSFDPFMTGFSPFSQQQRQSELRPEANNRWDLAQPATGSPSNHASSSAVGGSSLSGKPAASQYNPPLQFFPPQVARQKFRSSTGKPTPLSSPAAGPTSSSTGSGSSAVGSNISNANQRNNGGGGTISPIGRSSPAKKDRVMGGGSNGKTGGGVGQLF